MRQYIQELNSGVVMQCSGQYVMTCEKCNATLIKFEQFPTYICIKTLDVGGESYCILAITANGKD